MRFMMLLKADRTTEAGVLPTAKDHERMNKYNEELVKAGVLVDAAGLQPSSKGAKVTFANGRVEVTDGPFAETKELIAGYWMIRVGSREEAIRWAKRAPFEMLPQNGRPAEIELRQMFELEDLPDVPAHVVELHRELARGRQQPA